VTSDQTVPVGPVDSGGYDIAADADPYTGYLEYLSGFPKINGTLEPGWGGTSFVAPQLNGPAAVIDSYLHHRVGFWNPAIYKFAAGPNSPFTPLDSASVNNDKLYYTGTAGQIYNPRLRTRRAGLAELAADFRAAG
jgi:kumamolisin